MSPKSRGRPAGRGKAKRKQRGPVREVHLAELLVRDARRVADRLGNVLDAERWVSEWLGRAWLDAPLGERQPEHLLGMGVVGRVCTRPSVSGTVAVAALRRVMPESDHAMLDGTLEILAESQSLPVWRDAPGWTPVRAWSAVDVWDSERLVFVDYDVPVPHTLMAQIGTVGGVLVETLGVLSPAAAVAWADGRDPALVPMPLTERPVDEVLAELADALRTTDLTWPRQEDPDYVAVRALAWSRCRANLPPLTDSGREPMTEQQRRDVVAEFLAADDGADEAVTRSLAELFLDYGDGYITAGPLCWSPGTVSLFLADWLPRKAVLSVEQRAGLGEALRRWVRFALERRDVPAEWIMPVVEAVDEWLPEFEEAFDRDSSWGPAKQIAAELAGRGVDLTDRDQVGRAVRELNAERLARLMLDE